MKNLDSIPHMLNGIFRELNNATNVTVTLHEALGMSHEASGTRQEAQGNRNEISSDPTSSIQHPGSRIQTVNGCNTPTEFYYQIYSLCSEVRLSIVDSLSELLETEKAVMLIEAFNRVNILKQKISNIIVPSDLSCEAGAVYVQLKGFTQLTILSVPDQLPSPSATDPSLLYQLNPFADQMKQALLTLSHQLLDLAILLEHHKDICIGGTPQPAPLPVVKKLRLKVSVSLSGAFARILYDTAIFDIRNKSELCRTFAALISTTQQEEVSPLSLRNHFNNPSHECLVYIDAKLSEWRSCIRKLMMQN